MNRQFQGARYLELFADGVSERLTPLRRNRARVDFSKEPDSWRTPVSNDGLLPSRQAPIHLGYLSTFVEGTGDAERTGGLR